MHFYRLPIATALLAMLAAGLPSGQALAQASAENAAPKAIGGGSGLIVGGIEVDTEGKTDTEARLNGWREAQRLAWPELWARISGQEAETAPKLSDSTLDSMVSAIEIEREQLGGNRYVARLAVVFDRPRASAHLGKFAELSASPPLLLLPVLQDAAVRQAHEADNPWMRAWARLRAGESPIDYVRIQPGIGDILLLNAWQASRRNLLVWRNLIDRYQVADVLIPELILDRNWAGGPVSGLMIVRFGTMGREIARVRLNNMAGDVDGLMDEAVRQADRAYVNALRGGYLTPNPDLLEPEAADFSGGTGPMIGRDIAPAGSYSLNLQVSTPDGDSLAAVEQQLRAIPGVMSVRALSAAPGGTSTIAVETSAALDVLRYEFDRRNLRIDGNVLRPRRADEAPLPPPLVEDDMVVESDSPPSPGQ